MVLFEKCQSLKLTDILPMTELVVRIYTIYDVKSGFDTSIKVITVNLNFTAH